MNRHILLVSRHENRIAAQLRLDVLKNAGYRPLYAESLGRAVALICALQPNIAVLAILEQSYSEREKKAFIDFIHESHPHIHVLRLDYGDDGRPDLLIKACSKILSHPPGDRTVHTLQQFDAKSA